MERTLLLSALIIGGLGWLSVLISTGWKPDRQTGEGPTRPLRAYLLTAIIITLIVFFGSMPSHPPFSPGMGLGAGFLVGSLGAIIAGLTLQRSLQRRQEGLGAKPTAALAPISPMFIGCVITAIPGLWMRANLIDALCGAMIGWFVSSFLLIVGWIGQGEYGRREVLAQMAGVGFTITLLALSVLGNLRNPVAFTSTPMTVSWGAVGTAFGVCVPFLILLSALVVWLLSRTAWLIPGAGLISKLTGRWMQDDRDRNTATQMASLLPGALILLWVARLFAKRIEDHPPFLMLTALGLLVGLIAWRQCAKRPAERSKGTSLTTWQSGAFAALAILAGVMAAQQELAGFGVGILLLGAWMVVGCAVGGTMADSTSDSSLSVTALTRLISCLIFGLALMLYRIFTTRFMMDLEHVELTDHYALFGFLLGALLPILLAGFLASERGVIRILTAGAITLFVPALVLILFGAKCCLALYFGLALAAAWSVPGAQADRAEDDAELSCGLLLPALFSLAVALALTQWTHHILPMALYDRALKIRIIEYTTGALVILILAADYSGRFQTRLKARKAGSVQSDAKGATK